MKKRILIFCDYYLPGFKSGGGVWTLVNLVNRFSDHYDFFIVTHNHDGKTDREPYTSVESETWNTTGAAQVYYASRKTFTVKLISKLTTEISPDLILINSIFSMPSILTMTAKRRKLLRDIRILIFTCGELSKPSLSVRKAKKMLFLAVAKRFGSYRKVLWKASFDDERRDIEDVFGTGLDIMLAPDLLPKDILPEFNIASKPTKSAGSIKLIFVSRIDPKKNLSFLLECLSDIEEGSIELEIIGPHEDVQYWSVCKELIARLPQNIAINVVGSVTNTEALERMSNSHFFVLPTLSENFGYVFIEAMAAGCPLLISERTVWNDIEDRNVGWELPLASKQDWVNKLKYCINMNEDEYVLMSNNAREYAIKWLNDPDLEKATARVLEHAISSAPK